MTPQQAIEQLQSVLINSKSAMKKGEKKVADIIVEEAKSEAPGLLSNKIYNHQTEEETIIVGGDDLSAYVEFGTGEFAAEYTSTLPPEIQKEAYDLFFVNGKGKGRQQPFFYPAIFHNQDNVITSVDDELQKLAK